VNDTLEERVVLEYQLDQLKAIGTGGDWGPVLEEYCDQFSISDKLLLLLSESRTCAAALHVEGLPVLFYMKTVLLCWSWGICFSARDS
jgi:hypothetical protein